MVAVGGVPTFDEIIFFKKSLFRFIFCKLAAFLNTDGFAGVERGVGGVAVPSETGVPWSGFASSVCSDSDVEFAVSCSLLSLCPLSCDS